MDGGLLCNCMFDLIQIKVCSALSNVYLLYIGLIVQLTLKVIGRSSSVTACSLDICKEAFVTQIRRMD
ncbi:hypothetical protein AAZX31_13G225300 [Glycine max]|uniref:Uncharacterized protein n=2 Tax=Glycine subgen. Soja TaxID=1462606 RepID=K7M1M3_SOYBN|nr:hypothetical protein JHK87_037119 [Glycine soja]KAG4971505.1 hypothetical protein JHK85_037926 [Glycine max]KAG4977895.1 hypothetical protein JHK86_037369 [Glycine max]KAG5113902.1 hypothetical protein JHK82_037171 [Glycine max]KAG5131180.1 hypothetical protein JHK84_037577 [Glycine max]